MTALGALPFIPGGSCPSAAAALGAAGLGPVCQLAPGVAGVAGSAVSQLAGFGVDSVLNALGTWVAGGATWLLAQIGGVLGATTGIDLGASWFTSHYGTMAALASVIIMPFLLLGIIQSIYRQSASMLVRSIVVNVPLAILLTAVAVRLVQLGLAVTDAMSAAVAQGAGLDTGHFMASVTLELSGTQAASPTGVPAFLLFLGALAVVFGAVLVWIELLIRASAVYVAVLFLPLAMASLAWPAVAHWCRRLVDTLLALILGKFVIVSVLSLAVGALAGGTGSTPSGASGSANSSGGGGFGAVLSGAALLLLSAFAPWALFRLLPFLEGGAIGHLEGLGHRARQPVFAPAKGLVHDAMRVSMASSLAGAAAGTVVGALGGAAGSAVGKAARGGAGGDLGGALGGGGPAGSGPDQGQSSAQSTGVGTTESPGHAIPAWAVHPEATAAARHYLNEGLEHEVGHDPGDNQVGHVGAQPSAGVSGSPRPATGLSTAALKPLPRQTGALRADALGRDELGIRLVAAPAPPSSGSGPGAGTTDAGALQGGDGG